MCTIHAFCHSITWCESICFNLYLQSEILNCRWATLSILRKAERIWRLRNPPLASIVDSTKHPEPDSDEDSVDDTPPKLTQRHDQLRHEEDLEESYATFAEVARVSHNWALLGEAHAQARGPLYLGAECYIPARLLQGPWTEDKTLLLFYVTRAGARIDYLNSTNGEVGDLRFQFVPLHIGCVYTLSMRTQTVSI